MDVDKRNEELDETIIQTCKWIQKKLQISDKSIRDEKVPEMMSALAELVSARNERGERSCIICIFSSLPLTRSYGKRTVRSAVKTVTSSRSLHMLCRTR